MKLYIFGSCSGTEPMEGRHHTAWALEVNDRFYWFDAGENCSHTAYTMGVDLLKVSDIFISHPHMDHVGGLGNLLWNIRKLSCVNHRLPQWGDVTVYIPNLNTFEGVLSILKNSEGNYQTEYQTHVCKTEDGTIFQNGDVEITALHNRHLPKREDGWQSFSFRITAQNKTILYSGDVGSIEDLSPFLLQGCDLLLMETGHHSAEDVCQKLKDADYAVGTVCFLHHGRGILGDYDGTLQRCAKILPSVILANDKDVFEI